MFVLCLKCLDNIPKQSPEDLVPIRLFSHPLQTLGWILEENRVKFAQEIFISCFTIHVSECLKYFGIPNGVSLAWLDPPEPIPRVIEPVPKGYWNRAMSLDFKKYFAKGVIGDLSAVALFTSGANWKMKVEYLHKVTFSQKPFKAPASCAWVHFADTSRSDETWCKVKKRCMKDWRKLISPSEDLWDGFPSQNQRNFRFVVRGNTLMMRGLLSNEEEIAIEEFW